MNEGRRILQAVGAALDACGFPKSGAGLIVAVSGGADSLCLLHVLRTLAPERGLGLHVAHLNHQIRGEEADADAAYVADLCARWHLPFTTAEKDVPAYAKGKGLSLELAAREVRRRFLTEVAGAQRAVAIALGHHADDQAETILHRIIRGTGIDGLAGMAVWSPPYLRPLLAVTRAEIDAYCDAHGLAPRIDHTNLDPAHTRNRLRHEVLPLLRELNPRVNDALRRLGRAAEKDRAALEEWLDAVWVQVATHESSEAVALDREAFRSLGEAAQRRVLRRALAALGAQADVGWDHIIAAARVMSTGETGAVTELPRGVRASLGPDAIRVSLGQAPTDAGPQIAEATQLVRGERVNLGRGWAMTLCDIEPDALPNSWKRQERWQAWFDADRLAGALSVRPRMPGDRLVPLGMGGGKKVGDIMTDRKLPLTLRARWPLLVDDEGVVWVVGGPTAARVALHKGTRRITGVQVFLPDEEADV